MLACENLLDNLGYSCHNISNDILQLVTPFTKGNDGELIGVYIQRLSDDRYRVTDGGDSLAHMMQHNIRLNKNRTEELSVKGFREGVDLSEIGEFYAVASKRNLTDIVNRVLTMCLEVGHMESIWLGSIKSKAFVDRVREFLFQTYDHVAQDARLRGISGHQIEIAFSVKGTTDTSYLQPAGTRAGKLYWPTIYKVSGMMGDLREAPGRRFVILDDSVDSSELGAAITTLSEHASVLPFSRRADWHSSVAA